MAVVLARAVCLEVVRVPHLFQGQNAAINSDVVNDNSHNDNSINDNSLMIIPLMVIP